MLKKKKKTVENFLNAPYCIYYCVINYKAMKNLKLEL